ncbi:MAG TPA: nucleotidyltransferase family protein [Firmicutes bacterium]|nr:nucleotidyltransferase family protein [Bacillota bacterium]
MIRENETILELCKFLHPNAAKLEEQTAAPLDYPYILGQLLFHRMGAAGYAVLKRCGLLGRVNREFRNTLKTIYDSGVEKTGSFLRALEGTREIWDAADFPYALLKGAYLAGLYPVGLRTSNDIDVLIRPGDITALSGLLKDAGFRQGHIRNGVFTPAARSEIISSRMNRGETTPFIKRVNMPGMEYLELDVNFSLGFKPDRETGVVEAMLEASRPNLPGGLRTLSLPDFFLHLCAHLFKEATVFRWVEMGRDLSLYKFCDLYLLIDRFLDASLSREIQRRAESLDLLKECYYALLYTRQLFGMEKRELDRLIAAIRPDDRRFLKQVVDPAGGRLYAYDMAFTEWIFCSKRREHLHEVRDGRQKDE